MTYEEWRDTMAETYEADQEAIKPHYHRNNWIWYKTQMWKTTEMKPEEAYYLEESMKPQTVEDYEDYEYECNEELKWMEYHWE